MRLFPRAARRRLAAACAATTLAVGALAVPLAHAEGHHHHAQLKHRKAHAAAQVRHARHDLDESSSRLRSAQASLARARTELDQARRRYDAASARLQAAQVRDDQMQQALAQAQQRLAQAQARVEQGQQDLAAQHQRVTDTIADTYEQGDPKLLAFGSVLRARSLSEVTRQTEFDNVVLGRQTQAYDALRAAEVLLQVRENEVEKARDQVEREREAAARHLVVMRDLHQQARQAKRQVHAMVVSRRSARAAAANARRHDLRELHQARRREAHIRQLILRAARRAHGGYHGSTHGLLIPPVNGPVTSPFGWRIHPIYHYWGLHDGTDFAVSCGEGMKAVADGTVISKYWSDVYGNRLYVNLGQINGKNVTAVYNHATGYRVGVGDHVRQGEVVGYVGSTGWSTGCHLHFTILVNGTAVDPMTWLH